MARTTDSDPSRPRHLVVGAGSLGRAFLESLRHQALAQFPLGLVLATVRSRQSLDALRHESKRGAREQHWSCAALDLGTVDVAELRATCESVDSAVVCAAPSGSSTGDDVYGRGAETLARSLPPGAHLVWVSSTGVYAEAKGGLVDEDASEGISERAASLLRGEAAARSMDATILRFSGLVGPGRGPQRRPLPTPALDRWLNLLHVDDAVAALRWSVKTQPVGTFNVSGPWQRRRGFYDALRRRRGEPELVWTEDENAGYRVDVERYVRASGLRPSPVRGDEVD